MPEPRTGRAVRWLVRPATDKVPHYQVVGMVALRVTVGLMWLYNVAWKRAPDFGEEAGNGLYKFTSYAVEYPVFPPYAWLVETAILPNIQIFGWAVLASETLLAVMLLTGSWVRLAALLGIAQSLAIALSVAFAPHEWPWAYWLMIAAHLALLLSSAGRAFAVDALCVGRSSTRLLATVWGGLAVVVGLYSVAFSLDDPLDRRGPGLRSTDLSVSLGEFNLVGGVVVLTTGLLLILAARRPSVALAAAGLSGLGALSLYAQNGFTDPLLGGNPTSAAALLCLSVVAVAVTRFGGRQPTSTDDPRHQGRGSNEGVTP